MLDVLVLYLFLVVFIIILLYMILLYSNYTTSIIFRSNIFEGSTFTVSSTSSAIIVNPDTSQIEIKFSTDINFRRKKIYGKFKLVMSAAEDNTDVQLLVKDVNGETVAEQTNFTLYKIDTFGTTNMFLEFETSELNSGVHTLTVYAKSLSGVNKTVNIHEVLVYYY